MMLRLAQNSDKAAQLPLVIATPALIASHTLLLTNKTGSHYAQVISIQN